MKLYTRTGDDGHTRLCGSKRVAKDSLRVEAYGTVDELNSTIGVAAAACSFDEVSTILAALQRCLFDLGAQLATPQESDKKEAAQPARIGKEKVADVEQLIDRVCAPLQPLEQFIIPGGGELSVRLHVARTVCRRAERKCVTLSNAEPIDKHIVIYLNRLSDLLFALARRANQLAGVNDVLWDSKE